MPDRVSREIGGKAEGASHKALRLGQRDGGPPHNPVHSQLLSITQESITTWHHKVAHFTTGEGNYKRFIKRPESCSI